MQMQDDDYGVIEEVEIVNGQTIYNVRPKPMSDAMLSRRLGKYQAIETATMVLGIAVVLAGVVSLFVLRNVLVLGVLMFSGVGIIVGLSQPAQKAKRELLFRELGIEFREELNRTFGPEPKNPAMPISSEIVRSDNPLSVDWTNSTVLHFREGVHNGHRFSATNVKLERFVEERSGPDCENWTSHLETVFQGIIVRCADVCGPDLYVEIRDLFKPRSDADLTDPDVFRRYFAARNEYCLSADDRVTPEMRALVAQLESFAGRSKVANLTFRNGELMVALNTDYSFADLPPQLDLRDIDGIRKWFTASLKSMGQLIDRIYASPAVQQGAGETR